jgi:hypothetical protein
LAHNDIEFDLLKQVCADRKIDVASAVFQFTATKDMGNPPLSWHLSNLQKDAINDGWQRVGPEGFQIVRDFLGQATEFDKAEERLNFQTPI